jgi:stage V sporulation protein R
VNVQKIWGRPAHIETVIDDKPEIVTYDGKSHEIRAA